MSQNPQDAGGEWLSRVCAATPRSLAASRQSHWEDLTHDFTNFFTDQFGISFDQEKTIFSNIDGVSKERYMQIIEGDDAKIVGSDVVDYDETTQTLVIAPYFLRDQLASWCAQQTPALMREEFAFKIDEKKVTEIEANMLMIAKNYQEYGLIDKAVELPDSLDAMHKALQKMFDDALVLYKKTPPAPPLGRSA